MTDVRMNPTPLSAMPLGSAALLEAATAQMAALKDQPPIPLEITAEAAMVLISQLQLALRHPGNTGPGSINVKAFIAGLRSRIAAQGDPLDTLIEMGFDKTFDEGFDQ